MESVQSIQEYQASDIRLLLHLEPDELKVQNYEHIDVVVSTNFGSPVSNSNTTVVYVPYLLLSVWQYNGSLQAPSAAGASNKRYIPRKFAAYATSHCDVSHRNEFYVMLGKSYKRIYHINEACDNLSSPHNAGFSDRSNEMTWMTSVVRTFAEYKFAIVFESKASPGYVTEKLLLARLAGAIPIYYGSQMVYEFVNKDAFINCSPHALESSHDAFHRCIELIRKVDDDETLRKSMLSAEFFKHPMTDVSVFLDEVLNFVTTCKMERGHIPPYCFSCDSIRSIHWLFDLQNLNCHEAHLESV